MQYYILTSLTKGKLRVHNIKADNPNSVHAFVRRWLKNKECSLITTQFETNNNQEAIDYYEDAKKIAGGRIPA